MGRIEVQWISHWGALDMVVCVFFSQAEDGIRNAQESRGLGDVYKRQLVRRPKTDRARDLKRSDADGLRIILGNLPSACPYSADTHRVAHVQRGRRRQR